MNVLIAENDLQLGTIWARHLERGGAKVRLVEDRDSALTALNEDAVSVIILSLSLGEGAAMALADYAAYRQPDAKVIFVTASSFFSDGSIFRHFDNACACLPRQTSPEDLAALVEYHASSAA